MDLVNRHLLKIFYSKKMKSINVTDKSTDEIVYGLVIGYKNTFTNKFTLLK